MKLNGKIQTIKIRASVGRASLISHSIDSSPLDKLCQASADHKPTQTLTEGLLVPSF
jgi:hypothetical protein